MSSVWLVLACLCGLFLCLFLFAVFSPISVTLDSRAGFLRVCWMGLLELFWVFQGEAGESGIWIAKQRIVPGRSRERIPKDSKAARQARSAKGSRIGGVVARCLANSSIRRAIVKQTAKLVRGIARAFALRRSAMEVSLPDPASNGLLAGALAASGWARRFGVTVNFSGGNSLVVDVRIHLYRIAAALLLFAAGLPYRGIFRQWRLAGVSPRPAK